MQKQWKKYMAPYLLYLLLSTHFYLLLSTHLLLSNWRYLHHLSKISSIWSLSYWKSLSTSSFSTNSNIFERFQLLRGTKCLCVCTSFNHCCKFDFFTIIYLFCSFFRMELFTWTVRLWLKTLLMKVLTLCMVCVCDPKPRENISLIFSHFFVEPQKVLWRPLRHLRPLRF